MMLSILFLILICSPITSFLSNRIINKQSLSTQIYAQKYDPSTFVSVNIKKPLGISLEEVIPNEARGVYISEIGDGNAKLTNKLYKGLILININNIDVKYKTFDEVMDILINSNANEELNLSFIDNRSIVKGPAKVTVNLIDGKTVEINTIKG